MLRRLKGACTEQGTDSLQLSPRHLHVTYCKFEEAEQVVYEALEKQLQSKAKELVIKGTASKSLMQVLSMIVRLRQGMSSTVFRVASAKSPFCSVRPSGTG